MSHVLQSDYLPRLSSAGFEIRPTPKPVQDTLVGLYALRSGSSSSEGSDPQFHSGDPRFVDASDVGADILRLLQPIHEEFAGVALEPSAAYGLRDYQRGNTLRMHVDRVATHIVSSVLQVAQDVDAPWPLTVRCAGADHQVYLEPGQMVLYEGAACAHGRPEPLNGRSFVNLFVHYKPVDWSWSVEKLLECARSDGRIESNGDWSEIPSRANP